MVLCLHQPKTAHCLFIFLVGVNLLISYKKFKEKNREDFENDKNKYYSKYIKKVLKRVAVLIVAALLLVFFPA